MEAVGSPGRPVDRRVPERLVGKTPRRNLPRAWRMIAIDTNLLVYAHRASSAHHQTALATLQPVIEGTAPWALPWPCVHEFISICTHPGIYRPASRMAEALGFLDSLFGSPRLQLLSESP